MGEACKRWEVGWGWNMADGSCREQDYFRKLQSTDTSRLWEGEQNGEGRCHLASCDCFHGVAPVFFLLNPLLSPSHTQSPVCRYHSICVPTWSPLAGFACTVLSTWYPYPSLPPSPALEKPPNPPGPGAIHSLHSLLRPPKLLWQPLFQAPRVMLTA